MTLPPTPHPPPETLKVDDANFIKLVAILRIAVPYTGMILSTRESPAMRDALLAVGMSQVCLRFWGRVGHECIGAGFCVGNQPK